MHTRSCVLMILENDDADDQYCLSNNNINSVLFYRPSKSVSEK